MIKNIIILECDGCGIRLEERGHAMGPDEVIKWAKDRGWWAEYHLIRQYCPECKVSAKLALALGAIP